MNALAPPRAAELLLGHEAAERTLLEAWASGRFPSAWLICGPRGIGKATLAYRLARFILAGGGGVGQGDGLFGPAPTPETLAIPPDHPVFRRVAARGHADLEIVERGWSDDRQTKLRNEIVVEDARGVGAFLALTPAEGGWRIVIIDAADEMNRNAANAVLKVLEEPPRNALLLLVAHSPGRLLPTIRSRCRRLTLRPLAEPLVEDLLGRAHPELAEADRRALARLGEGSIGRALGLAAGGGLDLYREMVGLLAGLPRLDLPALHGFADRMARPEAGELYATVTELFGWWLARLVRAGAAGPEPGGEVVAGEAAVMARLHAAAGLDQWLEVWEKISLLFARAEAVYLDRKQVVLGAFLTVERLARRAAG